jgi:hypothetical protein
MKNLQPRFFNQGVETLVLCVASASGKKAWIIFKKKYTAFTWN